MSHENKTRDIPAGACKLLCGEFQLGDNGEASKTAPIRMVARSGKPIEHWYWGSVVHDLSGMRLHKSKVPIDYLHDDREIIGYLNHFDHSSGDLVTTGALVPFKDSDRATEIIYKQKAGVPYEASIDFRGEGIKIQELSEGEVAQVNGYQLEGPAVIIREWPLKAVAVCPHGADSNTESATFGASDGKVFHATVITEPETTTEGSSAMSESVDVAAQAEAEAVESTEAVDQLTAEAVETSETEGSVEAETPEAAEELAAVESAETELTAEAEAAPEVPEIEAEMSRGEFLRIVEAFGADIAAQTVKDGGDYASAMQLHCKALADERDSLRAQVAEMNEKLSKTGTPVKVTAASEATPLFKVKS